MSDGFLTAVAAVTNALFLLAGIYIYLALIRQIGARTAEPESTCETFSWPDVALGLFLATLFLVTAVHSAGDTPRLDVGTNNLVVNGLISAGVFLFIVAFLWVRGLDVNSLGGFSRLGFWRTLLTGGILLFAAYPLVTLADILTRHVLGGEPSTQAIVDFFTSSPTLSQRILIIVLAVAVAPVVEEFVFRFFLYGVMRRYVGRVAGLLVSAVLFAVVHGHVPSAAPLFVLGGCFTLAYEWSGSILVPMTMHALFNSLTLVALAFPDLIPQ